MSDYLFAAMGKGPTGTPDSRFSIKNSFMVSTSFALPIHNTGDLNIVSKIDTGCQFTSFSYRRLVDLADDIMAAKQLAISSGLKSEISWGVNDSNEYKNEQISLYKSKDYLNCKAISFHHIIDGIELEGYSIPVKSVKINYDRPRSVLIGMDILQLMEFYCNISRINGEYVFIGCLRNQVDKSEYYRALNDHFGYIQR